MAIGFPASHTEFIEITSSTPMGRASILRAMRSLGWSIKDSSEDRIRATTSLSFWSWGERVIVGFFADGATVTSSCALPTQCIDWGKNKSNVKKLLSEVRYNL